MVINSIGVYLTKSGDIAYITETDGYRRCYGYLKDTPHLEMSWYIGDGSVRHGLSCGPEFDNSIIARVKTPLPENAHEYGKECQRKAFEDHIRRVQERYGKMKELGLV